MRICVLAVALAALALLACADDDDGGGGAFEPSEQTASAPIRCLEETTLSNPEKLRFATWVATEPGTGALIVVERFPSPAFARQAELKATEVAAESVGRYFIHSPAPNADDGSTAAVAACLRGD